MNLLQSERLEKIEDQLKEIVSQRPDLPYASLYSAARYSLLSSGKRLRPMLVLAVCDSYGIEESIALVPACAIELIHTYSLIHDDLPCMDNDNVRRGKPTLHKVFPEWHALLTGDYLLTYAFEILSTAPELDADCKLALVQTLAKHAGADGMIGGQMIDLLSESIPIDWKILQQMHFCKTASLIIASMEFGGIISGISSEEMAHLRNAGAAFGVAFQLIDDLLDEEEINQKNKPNAVSLLGKTETQIRAGLLVRNAKQHLDTLSVATPLVHDLFEQMLNRKN